MNNKEKYEEFCRSNYVPIYSKPWWMDAVCGKENWDVWLYGNNRDILAAMPYYFEQRGKYKYITKAPLTQNNGIIFRCGQSVKVSSRHAFEEKVIRAADEYIQSLELDVYEQQYMHSFDNWLPFYWNNYTAITRYTYIIDAKRLNMEEIWGNISSKYRSVIRKSRRVSHLKEDLGSGAFYREHEKIFLKQDLQCPFPFEFWDKLYHSCREHECCKIFYMTDDEDCILSLMFLVWDEEYVYLLLGGNIPEFSRYDTYDELIYEGIRFAHDMKRKFDFEGSVIERISKSMREFGGIPTPYFRIRKVFNPDIVRQEAEQYIKQEAERSSSGGIK